MKYIFIIFCFYFFLIFFLIVCQQDWIIVDEIFYGRVYYLGCKNQIYKNMVKAKLESYLKKKNNVSLASSPPHSPSTLSTPFYQKLPADKPLEAFFILQFFFILFFFIILFHFSLHHIWYHTTTIIRLVILELWICYSSQNWKFHMEENYK